LPYNAKPCDLLTLKVVSKSRVTWNISVPILVFLGLSVLDLGPMYATDRCQTASLLNAPTPKGQGHKTKWKSHGKCAPGFPNVCHFVQIQVLVCVEYIILTACGMTVNWRRLMWFCRNWRIRTGT